MKTDGDRVSYLLGSSQSSFCQFPVAVFGVAADGHSCSETEENIRMIQVLKREGLTALFIHKTSEYRLK